MTFLIIGGALLYLICSVLAYKATFAYFQNEYADIRRITKASDDRGVALFMAVLGPMGLAITATQSGFFKHGFSVKEVD